MAGLIQTPLQEEVKPVPITPVPGQTATETSTTATTNGAPTTVATNTTTNLPATAGYNPTPVAAPTKWEVTPDQTVAGQVKTLIDENSPLMQQARTSAAKESGRRGLINSSMAVQAGENAVYQAAVPIATADAATYGKAAGYSVDQVNQTNNKNAEFTNAAAQFNATAANQRTLQEMNNETQVRIGQMDNANKLALQELTNTNQKLIQTNSNAASLMNQATGVINNIMMNDKMDAAAKTEASRQVYENLKTNLAIIGSVAQLDLSSLLAENPYGEQYVGMTPEQIAAAEASRLSQLSSDPTYAAMLKDYQDRQLQADFIARSAG